MKVVINACFGGFSLSVKAVKRIRELGGCEHKETLLGELYPDGSGPCERLENWEHNIDHTYCDDNARACPLLVKVVEELGKEANGTCAELKVVEIPDGIEWEIDEYDGMETVDEKHRSWS